MMQIAGVIVYVLVVFLSLIFLFKFERKLQEKYFDDLSKSIAKGIYDGCKSVNDEMEEM